MISFHLYQHPKFSIRCANQPWPVNDKMRLLSQKYQEFLAILTSTLQPSHLATSIVSKKRTSVGWRNKLNNHVSHVMTGFLGFFPDVGSFGTLQISSLNSCKARFPWHPMAFSIFQPPLPAQKETAIQPPRKNGTMAPCQALIFRIPSICLLFLNRTCPYPETQRPPATSQVKLLHSSRVSLRCRLNKVADASAWWNDARPMDTKRWSMLGSFVVLGNLNDTDLYWD